MSDDIFQRLRELDEIERKIEEARKAEAQQDKDMQEVEQYRHAGYSRRLKLKQERPDLYDMLVKLERGE